MSKAENEPDLNPPCHPRASEAKLLKWSVEQGLTLIHNLASTLVYKIFSSGFFEVSCEEWCSFFIVFFFKLFLVYIFKIVFIYS